MPTLEHTFDTPEFTDAARRALYAVTHDQRFRQDDVHVIYHHMEEKLRAVPFGEYLKRYIWRESGMRTPYAEVNPEEFRTIIRDSFAENGTPASFIPTTSRLSALSKNWLSQQSVHRSVVLLLGFGLRMSVADVNMFLTRALGEHELNAKSPEESICFYCYRFGLPFAGYARLRELYDALPPGGGYPAERTGVVRARLHAVQNEEELLAYLARLKSDGKRPRYSITARAYFDELYLACRRIIAELYNQSEEDRVQIRLERCRERLRFSDRMYDFEKQRQLQQILDTKRVYTPENISAGDVERLLYAEVPRDEHGNLLSTRYSALSELLTGRRLTRQRISTILSEETEIERYDLITLSFFRCAHMLDELPGPGERRRAFTASVNAMLTDCGMGEINEANPYECFLLMCLLSEDPLGTYTEIWSLSYGEE